MKISINPNKDEVARIRQQIQDNGGHCPCQVEHSTDTKCICKDFLTQPYVGWCHCGLYYKQEV